VQFSVTFAQIPVVTSTSLWRQQRSLKSVLYDMHFRVCLERPRWLEWSVLVLAYILCCFSMIVVWQDGNLLDMLAARNGCFIWNRIIGKCWNSTKV